METLCRSESHMNQNRFRASSQLWERTLGNRMTHNVAIGADTIGLKITLLQL